MASRFAVLSEGPHNLVASYDKKAIMETYSNPNSSQFGSDKQRDVFICSKTTSGNFVRTRWTTCHIYAIENHKFALYKEIKFFSCKLFLSYKIWLEKTMYRG